MIRFAISRGLLCVSKSFSISEIGLVVRPLFKKNRKGACQDCIFRRDMPDADAVTPESLTP